ncbi:ChaN family lipoprotein [Aureimonas fodinaquatilis]|uniref:ChaN family lipoprotein n=1 Tax=Aureimonas fodinaquatilis TaxID=2565783 RepID=A0A5B0DSN8_9HYPH|nr:ChaN family lipoprotein [Aureimonas fodinaquatilis]KAA0968139.1 ChaN family lipoprotein [Aureimonas fodinaquatilis]
MTSSIVHPKASWIDVPGAHVVPHEEALRKAACQPAILLGETHDDAAVHRWQLHVAAGLLALGKNIALGFEMFPRRVQPVLDLWVADRLSPEEFLEQSGWGKVWGFPAELYWPLFHFCRQFRVPMRALNCERPLVSNVGKLGWEAIGDVEREGITPAKPATDAYRRYLFGLAGPRNVAGRPASPDAPEFDRFVRAQQTWDRAFACRIAETLAELQNHLVIGIIGRGHLEYGHGTPFQLRDLGVESSILLPTRDAEFTPSDTDAVGDLIFRIEGTYQSLRAVA